jgi:hypothetical protein
MDTRERRVWGASRSKERVTLQTILVFTLTLTRSKTFKLDRVSVFDKYLHWPSVSVSVKNIYTLQQDKCKCKKFGHVSVNDLHLHWIYTPYIWLLTCTCATLVRTSILHLLQSIDHQTTEFAGV